MTQFFWKSLKMAYLCGTMGKNYTYVKGAEFPYQYKYEHMAVTTDCVIFTYEDWKLKVLLVRRGADPYYKHAPDGTVRTKRNKGRRAFRQPSVS